MIRAINKETDVAIRVLKFISKKNRTVTITDICKELELMKPFVRKILQILARNDILISKKGKNGGFLPARNSEDIYLIEIINIFHTGFGFLNCKRGGKCGDIKRCKLRKKLLKLERIMIKEFSTTTISDLY